MSGLRFAFPSYSEMSEQLLSDRSRESCAIAYANYNVAADAWVVSTVEAAPDWAYERRDEVSAVLKPAFLVEVANRARKELLSVILIHTHPWADGIPAFSSIDDEGEVALAEYFDRRVSDGSHLALVMAPKGCRARRLGAGADVAVWEVGENLNLRSGLNEGLVADDRHDRQVRAFGEAGQQTVGSLRVGIVGAGGTGSAVIQQLAYLGVADFTIVEPDQVEDTNLNRLIGSGPVDIDSAKVAVADRLILSINPRAHVSKIKRDVVDADVAPLLAGLDFIFNCTDSHASRAAVGQLAYQHLVPTIDMGVSITVRDGAVTHITGRVQMLAPGLTCLVCTGALDGEQIRRELLAPEQRAADPYIQGFHEPQPAVVSINSTMASLAVTMFLGAVTSVPAVARYQLYDGIRGTVRPTSAARVPDCVVCSSFGALARGVSWRLPLRSAGTTHG